MYCFRQEIYNGALIDNQRSSFYSAAFHADQFPIGRALRGAFHADHPMRLDGTSFALDAPSGGDFIETNVALEAVLQTV